MVADDSDYGVTTLEPEPELGGSVYGNTTYYSFLFPVAADKAYTALKVGRDGAPPSSFPLQNDMFVVPSRTAVQGTRVDVTVAARPGRLSHPAGAVVSAPTRQQGTLAPRITRYNVGLDAGATEVSGYQLWEGSIGLGSPSTGAVGVSVGGGGGGGGVVDDVLYLGAEVAGW